MKAISFIAKEITVKHVYHVDSQIHEVLVEASGTAFSDDQLKTFYAEYYEGLEKLISEDDDAVTDILKMQAARKAKT